MLQATVKKMKTGSGIIIFPGTDNDYQKIYPSSNVMNLPGQTAPLLS